MSVTFVLGGARSGKSRYAESLAASSSDRLYVATAQVFDNEMKARVAKHRDDRAGDGWITIEEPKELLATLQKNDKKGRFVLVDCLTLWLTNLLLAEEDTSAAIEDLAGALTNLEADIALVANEVGLGIVPENELARQFRDIAGIANQRIAEVADNVVFIAAGLPMVLKGKS